MMLVGSDFIDNNASFNTQMKRNGPSLFVRAYAASGTDENTPVAIQFMGSGYNATALAASIYAYVGVPEGTQSVGAGSWGWYQIRGPVNDVQATTDSIGSVGHAITWEVGTLFASTSAYQGLDTKGQIGVLTTEISSIATHDIYLTGAWATPIE